MTERSETPEQYRERINILGLDKSQKQLDLQEVGLLFPTPVSRRVFDHIAADTGNRESAIGHKKQTILEARSKNLIDMETLKKNPMVYVGSGIDWEYPVCLGGRDIILVDPILSDEREVDKLKSRIKDSMGSEPTFSDGQFQLGIDFGTGEEMISIKLDPTVYCPPERPPSEYGRFIPPEKIGMLLGFQLTGTDIKIDDVPEAMKSVVTGGYVLANNAVGDFFEQLSPGEQDKHMLSEPGQQLADKQKWWKEKGFDLIPLQTVGDTLLKKE